jgi:hypothetical protein
MAIGHGFALCPVTAHSGKVTTEHVPHEQVPHEQVPSALTRLAARAPWRRLPHPLRWLTVAIIGGTFVLVGIALLVLPGPGIAFIIVGLAILATEFVWAETLLHRVKNGSQKAWNGAKSRVRRKPSEPSEPSKLTQTPAIPQSQ